MSTLATVYARVRRLGGSVDREGGRLNLDAPQGKLWEANRAHTLAYYAYLPGERMSALVPYMLDDLKDGVIDCADPECDTCRPEGEMA